MQPLQTHGHLNKPCASHVNIQTSLMAASLSFKGFAFCGFGTRHATKVPLSCEVLRCIVSIHVAALMADTPSVVTSAPPPLRTIALRVTDLTPDSFAPYGQVIDPLPDGVPFGPHDAQLDLSRGIPRFYLMRLRHTNLRFTKITHHANTTQCLGSINGMPWYLGVTRPTIVGNSEKVGSEQALKGDGYVYLPPDVEDVRVFRVDGPRFLKLHRGTWHAGPLFEEPWMDFYNLELSRTNEVDHPTYNFKKNKGIMFEVEKPCS